MKWSLVAAVGCAVTMSALDARADAFLFAPSGPEFAIRSGYAMPFGKATAATGELKDTVRAAVPIIVDVGYRFIPHLMLGVYGQYGFGFDGDAPIGNDAVRVSSLRVVRAGLQLHVHLLPHKHVDPWLGVGAGYEWLSGDASAPNGLDGSFTLRGFELFNGQAGVDFKYTDQRAGLGPFAGLSMARFSNRSCEGYASACPSVGSEKLHQWLVFGLRASFIF